MLRFDEKIPAVVLGATGIVGQRFVELLEKHPWFKLVAVCGSARTVGLQYGDACNWLVSPKMPEYAARLVVGPLDPHLPVGIVFSALPADAARAIEPDFAEQGTLVCSNSSAYRYDADVPLVIPEVNAEHLALVEIQRAQRGWPGVIVTSPNCTTTGIALALKPLDDLFGIDSVLVSTMQAISGAGLPGISAMQICGNVVPHIPGEEEKIELETRILLGKVGCEGKALHPLQISAQANRVPVINGHTISLSVKLTDPAPIKDIVNSLDRFLPPGDVRRLPSAPVKTLHLHQVDGWPQPRTSSLISEGMQVSVGQIRQCAVNDIKMTVVVHNTLRGAAGGAILNAELAVSRFLVAEDQGVLSEIF